MDKLVQLGRQYWFFLTSILFILLVISSLIPVKYIAHHDKILHLVAYATLVFPLVLRKPKYWPLILIGYAVFGVMVELIQPYVNHRKDVMDMLANMIGLACGSMLASLINYFYPAR